MGCISSIFRGVPRELRAIEGEWHFGGGSRCITCSYELPTGAFVTLGDADEDKVPLWVDDVGFVRWQFPAKDKIEAVDSDPDSRSEDAGHKDGVTKKWSMKAAFLKRPDRRFVNSPPHDSITWDIIVFNMQCSSASGLFANSVEMLGEMIHDYMWSGGGTRMREEAVARITRRTPDIEADTPCDASENPDNECGRCRACCEKLANAAKWSQIKPETWEAPKEREGVSAKSRTGTSTNSERYKSRPAWLENRWIHDA
eukprot:TRINITY_DN83227_c0_g1_i1.p1 TRINITY_DN83227_c0_g1~~TRINITY_DN83227_c0_g1_i1.p1  ORF type:complete len:264 (+),score=42.02 TRINITY_DN83227_c0_g1_i1:26-793(+)